MKTLLFYCLIFLRQYEVASGSCKSEWIKALETSKDGNVVSGSKQALRQAVLSGSKLRIYTGSYSAGTQNVYAYKDEICAQSLFHISKDGWDRHQPKAYWWFLNLCTTGNVHMSRWYVGSHSQPSPAESKVKYNIKWFVRSANCDTESPVLSNTANGAVTNGSIQSLSDAIDQGYEINVVDGSRGYFSELTNIVRNKQKTLVAGTSLWHVSQTTITSHIEFQSNAYWWFTIWSSDGSRDISRWNVGQHTDRGHTSDRLPMNWFADTCWTLAYEHDENGLHIDGSLAYLRSAILVGRRVRLVYSNNYAVEADVLVVRNDHVIAQIIGHVSKANLKTFQSDAYWYFENVATTGQVEVIRYNVGSNVNRGSSKRRQSIKWFIDTRHWTNAYSNSETGADLKGSKTSLIQNVADGRAVRFTLKFPSSTGDDYVTVLNADNIDTSPDGNNLAAQHVRFISLQKEGLNGVEFQPNPYWNFVIAATTGRVDESRWTLGKHEGRGHISTNAAIDWFVS